MDPDMELWRQVVINKARKTDELIEEIQRLVYKLRDDPYESREEFREDLNELADKFSLLKARV
jgi:hypothetical protein